MVKDISKFELLLISKIAKRAKEELPFVNDSIMDFMMDIEFTPLDNPLKLDELFNADKSNFAHDIIGIHNYLDRVTKKLTDCFVPRYSV